MYTDCDYTSYSELLYPMSCLCLAAKMKQAFPAIDSTWSSVILSWNEHGMIRESTPGVSHLWHHWIISCYLVILSYHPWILICSFFILGCKYWDKIKLLFDLFISGYYRAIKIYYHLFLGYYGVIAWYYCIISGYYLVIAGYYLVILGCFLFISG